MGAAILNADEIGAKFSESIRTLSKLTGFSERTVTLAECGIVLKTCAGRTKVAAPKTIDVRAQVRALRTLGLTGGASNREANVSINAGLRGPYGKVFLRKKDGVGWRRTHNAGFQVINRHYKKGDWIDIQEAIADANREMDKARRAGQQSAGLSRQSWVQMADDLGITLEDVPGGGISAAGLKKARAAMASNGKVYANGYASATDDPGRAFYATLTNRLPYWPKLHFDSILAGVIAGRAKFFQQNVERAVFASYAETVRKYPWLRLVGAEPGG